MKLKNIMITLVFVMPINVKGMATEKLKKMIIGGQPSLKFLSALQVVSSTKSIAKKEAPAEVIDYVNKIRKFQFCTDFKSEEMKLFVNLLANPDIKIKKYFKYLILQYLATEKFISKEQLFDAMLLSPELEDRIILVDWLNELGTNVNIQNEYGDTPLIIAAENGYLKTVEFLIDKGAQINIQESTLGDTALISAARKGHKKIIQALVDIGADMHIKNKAGNTALIEAANFGHKDIVKILLANV